MLRTLLFSILLIILFSATAYASGTYAIVTGSRVNVRAYADIGTDNRLFQVERGTLIEIHGVKGEFFQASINGSDDVYISREFARITRTPGLVTAAPFARILDAPHGNAVSFVTYGEIVEVRYVYEDFFGVQFNDGIAFAARADIEIPCFVELPTARVGNALATEIIQTAKNYIGTPYRWGGSTPSGFDCSGFMLFIFTQHGIDLNRSSRDQSRNGIAVARDEIIPGDLLFFGWGNSITHVGMYIGGNEFIHSSSHSSGGVIICPMDAHGSGNFVTARRVIV